MTPEDDRTTRVRRTLEGVIGVPATEGNRIDVLRNGDEIFPAMLDAIDGAEHTIDFLTFVYWEGEIGTHFAESLATRAKAGVRVRVLLDACGARPIDPTLDQPHGGRGRAPAWFRPLQSCGSARSTTARTARSSSSTRTSAFTGGVGIADEWQGDARNEREWRDTHFRVRGPGGRRAPRRVPRQLGRDRPRPLRGRRRPLPRPAPARVERGAVRPRRVGDRLERRGHPVPVAAAARRPLCPDHDGLLRPRRGAHRPALRRGRPGRRRSRSCCPAPTPTSGSSRSCRKPRTSACSTAGCICGTSSRACCTPRS